MNRTEQIISLVDGISAMFGFKTRKRKYYKDLKTKGRASLSIGHLATDEIFEQMYEHLAIEKYSLALATITENKDTFMKFVNQMDGSQLIHINDVEEMPQIVLLKFLIQAAKLNDEINKEEVSQLKEQLSNTWLFDEKELSKKWDTDFLKICVEEAFKEKVFKVYQYRGGKTKVSATQKFRIYPKIGISYSMVEWFDFLAKQEQTEDATVALFLKLDYINLEAYSSFIISIHYKDCIWIATDQVDFDNPRNKTTTRNPHRHRNKHDKVVDLPYQVIRDLNKIRKADTTLITNKHTETISIGRKAFDKRREELKEKGKEQEGWAWRDYSINAIQQLAEEELAGKNIKWVVKDDESYHNTTVYKKDGRSVAVLDRDKYVITIYHLPEFLFYDLKNITTQQKIYFIFLVEKIFEEISFEKNLPKAMLAHQFVNQKLIAGDKFDYTEKSGLRWFNVRHRERLEEIIESIGLEQRALVKKDFSIVPASKHYEADWLATPKALETLSKWLVLEDEAIKIKEDIDRILGTKERREKDRDLLHKMLNDKYDRVLKMCFEQPAIELRKFDGSIQRKGSFRSSFDPDGRMMKVKDWFKVYPSGSPTFYSLFNVGYNRVFKKYGDSGPVHTKNMCRACTRNPSGDRGRFIIEIDHYNQLVFLLGLKSRKQLPLYFQNFRSHQFLPYEGNSILDNSHPYTLIHDPCSSANASGFKIEVYLCKRCLNRMAKEYNLELPEPVKEAK